MANIFGPCFAFFQYEKEGEGTLLSPLVVGGGGGW